MSETGEHSRNHRLLDMSWLLPVLLAGPKPGEWLPGPGFGGTYRMRRPAGPPRDAVAAIREHARRRPARRAVLLVGSDEILTAVRQRQQRWGINRLVIREVAVGRLASLLPRLRETTE